MKNNNSEGFFARIPYELKVTLGAIAFIGALFVFDANYYLQDWTIYEKQN